MSSPATAAAVTWAGVSLGPPDGASVQVVLPQAARETWTPRADFEVADTLGMQPRLRDDGSAYTQAQLTAFWSAPDHQPFGEDMEGSALWPAFDELAALMGLDVPEMEEAGVVAGGEADMFSAGESAELVADAGGEGSQLAGRGAEDRSQAADCAHQPSHACRGSDAAAGCRGPPRAAKARVSRRCRRSWCSAWTPS